VARLRYQSRSAQGTLCSPPDQVLHPTIIDEPTSCSGDEEFAILLYRKVAVSGTAMHVQVTRRPEARDAQLLPGWLPGSRPQRPFELLDGCIRREPLASGCETAGTCPSGLTLRVS
jgi:hypothetical protein